MVSLLPYQKLAIHSESCVCGERYTTLLIQSADHFATRDRNSSFVVENIRENHKSFISFDFFMLINETNVVEMATCK